MFFNKCPFINKRVKGFKTRIRESCRLKKSKLEKLVCPCRDSNGLVLFKLVKSVCLLHLERQESFFVSYPEI